MIRLRMIISLVLIAGTTCIGTAYAGDGQAATWRYNSHGRELPFPRGERAQAVWASSQCWRECGSYCAWGMAGWLKVDSQGSCLKFTDKCDRYCKRACRTDGGQYMTF